MRTIALAFLISAAPAAHVTPSDPVMAYVQQALHVSIYKRADADLNGDGRKETFVYVTDRDYCGSGGCTLFVLSPHGKSYRVVLRSTITQLPIRLLPTSAHGWHDIGFTLAGGGINPAQLVRVRFNGKRYPNTPTAVPLRRQSGRVLISG